MITLNLISPEQKSFLKIKQLSLFLRNLTAAILTFIIIISIVLVLTNNSLDLAYNLYKNTPDIFTASSKNATEINKKLKSISTVQNQHTVWSKILISLLNLIPNNIELKNFKIDKTTQVVVIEGTAKTRNDYLNLITALQNSKNIKDLKSPLENLLSKENINFSLSFIYQFNP